MVGLTTRRRTGDADRAGAARSARVAARWRRRGRHRRPPPPRSRRPLQASGRRPAASPTHDRHGHAPRPAIGGLPPVKHVFLIVLSDRGFTQSFGAGARRLSGRGAAPAGRARPELLRGRGRAAGQRDRADQRPGTDRPDRDRLPGVLPHQARAQGPARPGARQRLRLPADHQDARRASSTARRQTWKAYVAGVGSEPATACRVPKLGSDGSRRRPAEHRVPGLAQPVRLLPLADRGRAPAAQERGRASAGSPRDLKSASTTPSFAYIIPPPVRRRQRGPVPGRRAARPGRRPTGFLKSVVPEIKRSPAYRNGGLIAITFDQAPQTGPTPTRARAAGPDLVSEPAPAAGRQPAVPPAAMGDGNADDRDRPARRPDRHDHRTDRPPARRPARRPAPTTTTDTGDDDRRRRPTTTTPATLGAGATTPDRRRRPGRPAADLALRQAGQHRRRRLLQPLLAAGHRSRTCSGCTASVTPARRALRVRQPACSTTTPAELRDATPQLDRLDHRGIDRAVAGAGRERPRSRRPCPSRRSPGRTRCACRRATARPAMVTMKNCEPLVFGPGVGHRQRAADHLVLVDLVARTCSRGRRCRCPAGSRPGS